MSPMILHDDLLGKMFSSDEKGLLRDRCPAHNQARSALIVRLADALTFRRAPRGWQPPFSCFEKAALPENIDTSHRWLPAMSQEDFAKANEIMEYVGARIPQGTSRISSGVTADELKDILRTSETMWTRDGRDSNLARIVDTIPNNDQIQKVVCIGLGELAIRPDPRSGHMTVISQCLAQHLTVLSMVRHLRNIVSHEVELYAADWAYDAPHKEALESHGFCILDASYGHQEHFTAIDDNTMLISFSIADIECILPIVSEYARPVAIICDAYDYLIKKGHTQPPLSPVWSQVKYNNAWVTIPGPPMVPAGQRLRSILKGSPSPIPLRLPFYTESTRGMLEDYRIVNNMFALDVTGLANRFELHPDTDHRPRDANETEQKRFVGTHSRLFVRK